MSGNTSPIEALKALETQALEAVSGAPDSEALETLRIEYLGRKEGRVSGILRELGKLAPEERPAVGAEANRVKAKVQQALEERPCPCCTEPCWPGSSPGPSAASWSRSAKRRC